MVTYAGGVMMRPNWQRPSDYCLADATLTRHGVDFMNKLNRHQQIRELTVIRPNVQA